MALARLAAIVEERYHSWRAGDLRDDAVKVRINGGMYLVDYSAMVQKNIDYAHGKTRALRRKDRVWNEAKSRKLRRQASQPMLTFQIHLLLDHIRGYWTCASFVS